VAELAGKKRFEKTMPISGFFLYFVLVVADERPLVARLRSYVFSIHK
jgi:hypothetical protein